MIKAAKKNKPYNEYRQLWVAVLERAVVDWNYPELRKEFEDELRFFFFSEWFCDICRMIDMDPCKIRKACIGLTPHGKFKKGNGK